MATGMGTITAHLALRDKLSKPLQKAAGKLGKFGKVGKFGFGLVAAAAVATAAIVVVATKKMITAASDFEDSFTGVIKTVDATDAELQSLALGLRNMAKEIPVGVNELNKIAESAGQLGVKTEDILEFTHTMATLGVTTNLSSTQAATGLARFANVMDNETGPAYDRMASTLVGLGNNLATTEAEILEFGTRIAGAGKIAGLAEAEIFAIGAAMSSIGVKAEAGGTSVQKVLNKITAAVSMNNDELQVIAATAGMSAEAFSTAWETNAAGAFTSFVEGLGIQGNAAFQTLDDLNLGNERVITSFLGLAGAGTLLSSAIKMGTADYADNVAAANEAATRYATFSSHVQILKNVFNDLAITGGQIILPIIQRLTGDLSEAGKSTEFMAKAVDIMTGMFVGSLKVINFGFQVWEGFKQSMMGVWLLVKLLALALIKLSQGVVWLLNKLGLMEGAMEDLQAEEERLITDIEALGKGMRKSRESAANFSDTIGELETEIKSNADASKHLAVAQERDREVQEDLKDEIEEGAAIVEERNRVYQEGLAASQAATKAENDHTTAVRKLSDEFTGADLARKVEKISASYVQMTEEGTFNERAQEALAEALIDLAKSGEPIPAEFDGIIAKYQETTAETEALKEATDLAQSAYDRFSMDGPIAEAAALEDSFLRLTAEEGLNEYQMEQLGKAARALKEKGIELGEGLDDLAIKYADHKTTKLPSFSDAIGKVGTAFSNLATVSGDEMGKVWKKLGTFVTKIDAVTSAVGSVKSAFKAVNGFFEKGGWSQVTSMFGGLKKTIGGVGGKGGLVGDIAGVGTGAVPAGAQAATAFASFATVIGIGAVAAALLVSTWKSAEELANRYGARIAAMGPEGTRLAALAVAEVKKIGIDVGGVGSTEMIEDVGSNVPSGAASAGWREEGRKRKRLSQLQKADMETIRLSEQAAEAYKLGKHDQVEVLKRQVNMLKHVMTMRTSGMEEEAIRAKVGMSAENYAAAFGAYAFKHGGIVTSPTVGLLAEAGPEAVIPLNQMGNEQLLVEMRGLRAELRLLPLHLRDAILLAG